MRQPIQFLTACMCGLLLVTGFELNANEPLTETVQAIEDGVISTVTGSEVFEDTGYARISRRDWTAPTTTTVWEMPLVYSRMYPGKFYGQHGRSAGPVRRYPIIAVPTDTSQQGYYYRHVPSWKFRGGMLPPVPRPSRWHQRAGRPSHHTHEAPEAPEAPAPAKQAQTLPGTLR